MKKMIQIFMLVSCLPTVLFAAESVKKNTKVILSGNLLSSSQIVPVGGQAKTVMASGSGKIRFSSTRFCGDGDVARYSNINKSTLFYPAIEPNTNIVVGYWVSPKDTLDVNAKKFFAVGYTDDSKVDAGTTETLFVPNNGPTVRKPTFNLIDQAMKDMAKVANLTNSVSINGSSITKYNMKFVAMACPKLENTEGVGSSNGLNNLKINRQFLDGSNLNGSNNLADFMHDTVLESDGRIEKKYVNVLTAGSAAGDKSIDLRFENSGTSASRLASELTDLVNDLANASMPSVDSSSSVTLAGGAGSCSCETLDYKNSSSLSSIHNRLKTIKDQLNAAKNDKTKCDVGAAIKFKSHDYPWEVFPTNAACQRYHQLIVEKLNDFDAAFDNLFTSTHRNTCTSVSLSAPYASCAAAPLKVVELTSTEFKQRKIELNKILMQIVGTPNAIQVAQDRLKDKIETGHPDFALNTTSCFPKTADDGEFIKTISSSVGLQIDPNPSVPGQLIITIDKNGVIHPEGNFAIGGDQPYLDKVKGNKRILFNNTPGDERLNSSFQVELGMNSNVSVTAGAANATFHIRSIGCAQNVYCLNDR